MHICPDELNAAFVLLQAMTANPHLYLNPVMWLRCVRHWRTGDNQ